MLLISVSARLSQKGPEKKGTTKDTKSTKKSFFFLCALRVLRGSRLLCFLRQPHMNVFGKRLSQNINRTDIRYLNNQVT